MARPLALVSDPAAPRSVVVLIGPPPRRCQRVLSTNRRTHSGPLQCRKTPVFSVSYAIAALCTSHAIGDGAEKKFEKSSPLARAIFRCSGDLPGNLARRQAEFSPRPFPASA